MEVDVEMLDVSRLPQGVVLLQEEGEVVGGLGVLHEEQFVLAEDDHSPATGHEMKCDEVV